MRFKKGAVRIVPVFRRSRRPCLDSSDNQEAPFLCFLNKKFFFPKPRNKLGITNVDLSSLYFVNEKDVNT
jgi:hypothetical protein